ncbi:zinc finger CCCH domain-containing protein 7B isoform X8 [Hemicordylus capensis]|uniref:zinc finger CCCH domain-containing protein 7B isoform X8 n=1 Tax=Hemicordylus capensis TaxID=884348 RepID=UPI002303ACD1|nr:zinc finger CCCH domain-containing protein 7B isoform X8 [Hemicordylus capensis]
MEIVEQKMTVMERQKRKEEIEKGLQFIQSTLPLSQEDYEAFLQKLVQNLFAEGNDLFREKDFKLALVQYVEGLNVADYAASDEVTIPVDLLCKLHVNRAACYFAMGLYEKSLEDSEKALGFSKESIRALFRKARCLNELGRYKEAYECNSRCLLSLPHDESVAQLGQELAQKLGLRVRKAYKRPQTVSNGLGSVDDIETEETSIQEPRQPASIQKPPPVANHSGSSHTTVPKVVELLMSQPESAMPNTALLVKNPLASTHIFKQACHICYPKTGLKAGDYTYREGLEHKCKRDILLGRRRNSDDKTWKRIRPRPTKTNFVGSYYLCKDMLNKQDCKYGDNCTFAYHQEEIDVWTEERKGTLNRDLLFDPLGGVKRGSLTIAKILKEHQGIFTFLCEICFDSKPRIISKGTKDSSVVCSNLAAKHGFYDNKCLVHIVRSTSLKYSKIRQFQEHFQFDVCRHEVRYGCLREDSCHFAHSFIELKVWLLQQYSGMTHEDIVQESKKYWQQMEAHASKANNTMASTRTPTSNAFELEMKFVCGQCWRNGQVVEPDKDLKYCSAKARHCWTKERRVLLVKSKAKKKWVFVRPLPSIRNFPQQYDLCIHAQNGRKCQYVGNCSFAHSPEEREMWTFMKENKILDMQQTYDMWLKKHNPGKPGEGTPLTSREGEKQIQMPTDYADMMGYHCWLCGKNSNSKKQWQQHIQSEKHKEKVFTSDNDSSCWNYRFPMGEFRLCERSQKAKPCPEGEKCRFAHGQDELSEWLDRREVMKQKLAKARKDMLLCPRDDDFGKYNFLLRDSM